MANGSTSGRGGPGHPRRGDLCVEKPSGGRSEGGCGDRARHPVHRRPSAREPFRRSGTGVFRGRHDRSVDYRAIQVQRAPGRLAHVGDALQGHFAPLPEIGRELHVDAVVEGSVLKAEGRVRVSAQLIDARTDRHLWVERLRSRPAGHPRASQRRGPRDRSHGPGRSHARRGVAPGRGRARPIDPEAYEAYLRGRYYFNRTSEADLEKGVSYFERALVREPRYAAAYSGLADCYNRLGMTLIGRPPGEMRSKAIAAASEALRIDGGLAEAHVSLGWAKFFDRDWPGAEESFQRAMALQPEVCRSPSIVFPVPLWRSAGSTRRSPTGRRAVELDPLSLNSQARLGQVLFYARRYDDAIQVLPERAGVGPELRFRAMAPRRYLHAGIQVRRSHLGPRESRYAIEEKPGGRGVPWLCVREVGARSGKPESCGRN